VLNWSRAKAEGDWKATGSMEGIIVERVDRPFGDPGRDGVPGFPYDGYGSGWYPLEFSDALAPGDVMAARCFGQDVALWRTVTGEALVFDAHCPHMGAHLGFGSVDEDQLVCPYHGWSWGADGVNTNIPYERRPNPSQACQQWPVHESAGFIFVWYDKAGCGPTWTPRDLPEASDPGFHGGFPTGAKTWTGIRLEPLVQMENLADAAHFKYVHRHAREGELLEMDLDGPFAVGRFVNYFGSGRPSKYATEKGYIEGANILEGWGLGTVLARHETIRNMLSITAMLPVDRGICDVRMAVWIAKSTPDEPVEDELVQKLIRGQFRQLEADLQIFHHQRYRERPPYTKSESRPFQAVRAWAKQFYSDVPALVETARR
jgi:nitrite reductase/ring-hydroxylating ferredoxin subunit